MIKTIMITGATDGIGLETAKKMATLGHNLIIHGRNEKKLAQVQSALKSINSTVEVETFVADLSVLTQVSQMANDIMLKYKNIDVLINNAGVFKSTNSVTEDTLDVRFAVNTIAPYILSKSLMPSIVENGRIINLSSAAQTPVDVHALSHATQMTDMEAYAQSKRAIRLWTKGLSLVQSKAILISVNPGSLLASKMVSEGFGIQGNDISIGVEIISTLALEQGMQKHNGDYFDNDNKRFSDDLNKVKEQLQIKEVIDAMEAILIKL